MTRVMLSRPADKSVEAAIEHSVRVFKAIGSPGFPTSDAQLRELRRRCGHGAVFIRSASCARWSPCWPTRRAPPNWPACSAPTLVLHGKDDPLVPLACGEDTARRIPGARLVGIDGMGHDLPPGVVERLLALLIPHFEAAP